MKKVMFAAICFVMACGGGTIEFPEGTGGSTPDAGVSPPVCIPTSCATFAEAGAQCGVFDDGCGNQLDCMCQEGMNCDQEINLCVQCHPNLSCVGKCGLVYDGCGAEQTECGKCQDGLECVNNQCE